VSEETERKLRRVLREPEARAATGLGKTQFWAAVDRGDLPQPFRLFDGSRALLWFQDELIDLLERRSAVRNQKGPPVPRPVKPASKQKQQRARV
jgi:predicted DNA-binding transcriptional regulator AlpA